MADYKKPVERGLESIKADKFPSSFEENLSQTNQSLEFLSKVVLVMQRGIDEADDTVFDDIKQLADELVILFSGGTLGDGALFPDLDIIGMFTDNIKNFLGFDPAGSGGVDVVAAAKDFIDNILNPTGKLASAQQVQAANTTAGNASALATQAAADAAAAASGQNITNMAFVYNSEKESMRAKYPGNAMFSYYEDASVSVSGTWTINLSPPSPTTASYPTMRVGPDFDVTPGEKIYLEWKQRRSNASTISARLNLLVLNSAGGVAKYDLFATQPPASADNNVWVTYSGIVTIPANGSKVTPQLKMAHPSGTEVTGQILFEDIIIRRAIHTTQVIASDGKTVEAKTQEIKEATVDLQAAVDLLGTEAIIDQFGSNGVWTKRPGVKRIQIRLVGGGGAGGGGTGVKTRGMGGGLGGFTVVDLPASAVPNQVNVVIGEAGVATNTSTNLPSTGGTATIFDKWKAGGGGPGGTFTTGQQGVPGSGTDIMGIARGGDGGTEGILNSPGSPGFMCDGGLAGVGNTPAGDGSSPDPASAMGPGSCGGGGAYGGSFGSNNNGRIPGNGGFPGGGGGGGGGGQVAGANMRGGSAAKGCAWIISYFA